LLSLNKNLFCAKLVPALLTNLISSPVELIFVIPTILFTPTAGEINPLICLLLALTSTLTTSVSSVYPTGVQLSTFAVRVGFVITSCIVKP